MPLEWYQPITKGKAASRPYTMPITNCFELTFTGDNYGSTSMRSCLLNMYLFIKVIYNYRFKSLRCFPQFIFLFLFSCSSESSGGTYGSTSNAFIFSLRNKEGLPPFKSMVAISSYAIYRYSGYGPTFGGGHDIKIADNANSNTNSYTNFGESNYYSVPSGVQNSYTVLAGTRNFTPDEVEVFYLG